MRGARMLTRAELLPLCAVVAAPTGFWKVEILEKQDVSQEVCIPSLDCASVSRTILEASKSVSDSPRSQDVEFLAQRAAWPNLADLEGLERRGEALRLAPESAEGLVVAEREPREGPEGLAHLGRPERPVV